MREFPVVLDDSREHLNVTRFAATGAGFISFRWALYAKLAIISVDIQEPMERPVHVQVRA